MVVEASDKPKFCDDDDNGPVTFKRLTACEKNTWNSKVRKLVSYEDSHYDYDDDDDDDDDVPLSARLLRISNLGTCSSNCDDSVKKRSTTMPVKRPLDEIESDSLQISVKKSKVKKSKVSQYDDDDEEEDDIPISRRIKKSAGKSADESFSITKKFVEEQLALVEKSFEACQRKRLMEEQRLQSLKKDIKECSKELRNKKMQASCVRRIHEEHKKVQGKIEECVTDLVAKEAQLYLMEDLIGERKQELKTKEIGLHLVKTKEKELSQIMDEIDKDCERKEEEHEALSIKVAECTKELKTKEKELDEIKKLIGGQAKELESERKMLLKVMSARTDQRAQMKNIESMKKQFEGQVKELESKQKQCEGQVKELASKEKHFEERVKKLESKEKQLESKEKEFEGQIKQLKSEKKHFQSQVKELESKEKQFEGRVKELESKEKQLEGQVKEFVSKKVEFECQMKDLESQKKHFESQVKELQSEEKQFEGRVKELELKEKQLEGRLKEFESKEEEFEGQLKELESKNKHFESRLKELESKEEQLKGRLKEFEGQVKEIKSRKKYLKSRVKELGSKEKQFEGRVREFESKEKQLGGRVMKFQSREEKFEGRVKEFQSREEELEGRVEEFKSKQKLFEGQVKDLELREKQYEALINSSEEEKESGNQLSLQLLPIEQRDGVESLGNAILVNLLASSDPSNVVLDIIQDPIIPQCRKGHNAVTIDGSHIVLLVQLMRISPHIKPHVREKAMKLALDLKADMSENSEAVLGFLLLLSIYRLVPSFDQDEVLKLFGFAAQHKIAVELFGTLGFADKIADFVQSLIRRQQHIEAVRFICAYNLTDKYQPVDLLREHVQNAELISERSCKKTDSIEIKDKARDEEIASLGTVLECISDNNLESEDLHNEIQDRILELNRQRRIAFVLK